MGRRRRRRRAATPPVTEVAQSVNMAKLEPSNMAIWQYGNMAKQYGQAGAFSAFYLGSPLAAGVRGFAMKLHLPLSEMESKKRKTIQGIKMA